MPTVLLVEDHVRLGQLMVRLLRERGNMEVWANLQTAEVALETLRTLPATALLPNLALVDIALPGMNGIKFVAELKRRYPSLPCLMLSGHVEAHAIRQALAAGARGYIVKEDAFSVGQAVQQVLAGKIFLSNAAHLSLAP